SAQRPRLLTRRERAERAEVGCNSEPDEKLRPLNHLPWLYRCDGVESCGHERADDLDVMARRDENDDSKARLREVLLELDALVFSQEHLNPRVRGSCEELAVLHACPPVALDGAHVMTGKQ